MQFSTSFIPEIRFAPGAANQIAAAALALSASGKIAIVMDGFLATSGLGDRLAAELKAGGADAVIYSGFSGEPKLAHVEAASEAARGHAA